MDAPVQTEDTATTSHLEVSQPISFDPEVTIEIPIPVPISTDFFEIVYVPSLTATVSTPISITPCPPVSLGVSQPPPIFSGSTTKLATTVDPPVSVNASDAGEGASGFTTGDSTHYLMLRRPHPLMINLKQWSSTIFRPLIKSTLPTLKI